jgi:hypothetical protein
MNNDCTSMNEYCTLCPWVNTCNQPPTLTQAELTKIQNKARGYDPEQEATIDTYANAMNCRDEYGYPNEHCQNCGSKDACSDGTEEPVDLALSPYEKYERGMYHGISRLHAWFDIEFMPKISKAMRALFSRKHLCLCGEPANNWLPNRELWACDKHVAIEFGMTIQDIDGLDDNNQIRLPEGGDIPF